MWCIAIFKLINIAVLHVLAPIQLHLWSDGARVILSACYVSQKPTKVPQTNYLHYTHTCACWLTEITSEYYIIDEDHPASEENAWYM